MICTVGLRRKSCLVKSGWLEQDWLKVAGRSKMCNSTGTELLENSQRASLTSTTCLKGIKLIIFTEKNLTYCSFKNRAYHIVALGIPKVCGFSKAKAWLDMIYYLQIRQRKDSRKHHCHSWSSTFLKSRSFNQLCCSIFFFVSMGIHHF